MLSLPALALAAPDQVVSKVYNTHLKTQDMRKTIQQVPKCFTPGLLSILERALKGQPPRPIRGHRYFLQQSDGSHSEVRIKVWDSRSKRKDKPQLGRVILTDVKDGDGYQIRDIEWEVRLSKFVTTGFPSPKP